MGRPRSPRAKTPTAPSAERHRQEALLQEIQAQLEEAGLTPGWIRALPLAYAKRGAAAGLLRDLEKEWRDLVPQLKSLLETERLSHAKLHELIGGWSGSLDLAPQGRGARTRYIQSLRGRACDLRGACSARQPEIKRHAEFIRWLEAEVNVLEERAGEPWFAPTMLRHDIERYGEALRQKGAIVALLHEEQELELKDAALFILANGYGVELPISPTRLADTAHSMSEALRDWRSRQKRWRVPRRP